MRKLNFTYEMQIHFSEPVFSQQFTFRMIPMTNDRQKIQALSYHIEPCSDLMIGEDSFGNILMLGKTEQLHRQLKIEVNGTACINGKVFEKSEKMHRLGFFKVPSKMTVPNDALKKYFEPWEEKLTDHLSVCECQALMHDLHDYLIYEKNMTHTKTTAAEAFSIKKGVCQDYAHIYLSLLRMAKIPARYIVGIMEGEGESHAWTEVCIDGKWVGFDPTNDRMTEEQYIKFAAGRDYMDCVMNKGIIYGGGMQTQQVKVKVMEEGK